MISSDTSHTEIVFTASDIKPFPNKEEVEEVADQARLDKTFLKCSTLTETLQLNLENWLDIPSYPTRNICI